MQHKCSASAKFASPSYLLITCLSVVVEFFNRLFTPPCLAIRTSHLDRLCIMPKKSELKLSKYIDDAFVVPNAEAELAEKSSLELADASVTMIYKVHISLFDFVY